VALPKKKKSVNTNTKKKEPRGVPETITSSRRSAFPSIIHDEKKKKNFKPRQACNTRQLRGKKGDKRERKKKTRRMKREMSPWCKKRQEVLHPHWKGSSSYGVGGERKETSRRAKEGTSSSVYHQPRRGGGWSKRVVSTRTLTPRQRGS